jgi:hypothetical protein
LKRRPDPGKVSETELPMKPFSHRKAILTGRSLAEVVWATTAPSERTPTWTPLANLNGLTRIPRPFAPWVGHAAAERWRELFDAEKRVLRSSLRSC